MWTAFDDDLNAFRDAYMDNQKKYGDNHGVLSQSEMLPPPNSYTVSCVPWISFEHFSVHSYENKPYYFPSVESGRFFEKDGKTLMPLSITCHHAATDGYHVILILNQPIDRYDSYNFVTLRQALLQGIKHCCGRFP